VAFLHKNKTIFISRQG
jgi:WD40 repeat protein